MQELIVKLGARSYPVQLRPLAELGEAMAALESLVGRPGVGRGVCALVSNDVVAPLYADAAAASLEAAGWAPIRLVIPDGEENKTLDTWRDLVLALIAAGVDRKTPVVALGGGVTGDIVAFAAASALRGLPVVQVPTTLLSMVDSSVGGKTGVNTDHGKNLVGAFWQPSLVLADVATLDTLDDAELRCGLGEVVKHAVIEDEAFFAWLEENAERILARDREALRWCVRRCCEIKAAVVSQDERESGRRAVLNLGHTIGHAIEAELGYGALRHGEAVGIGMVAEAWLAAERGAAEPALYRRIAALLERLALPTRCAGVDPEALVDAARMDKKRAHGRIVVTVPRRLGEVVLETVDFEALLPAAAFISQEAR